MIVEKIEGGYNVEEAMEKKDQGNKRNTERSHK